MRVNITAWCRCQENYSLEITENYLKSLNEWIHEHYPSVEFEDITIEDIYAVFNIDEHNDKLNVRLDEYWTLGEYVEDYVRDDVWESYEDNEYCEMEDYDVAIGFDSSAEKARFLN